MKVFLIFLLVLSAGMAPAVENKPDTSGLQWQTWSPEVFARATQQQKLVLLKLTAEWCQFCRKMDATTWRDRQVINVINQHYIPVRADEAADPEVSNRFAGYGRPATVILAGDGAEIIKRRGYMKPQWMYWMLEAVAQNPSPEAHK